MNEEKYMLSIVKLFLNNYIKINLTRMNKYFDNNIAVKIWS
ncbi:hypothetical protein GXM_07893 [Nostoc sphaeroides CCNUC1]|uniref:Uncharacterized protein n=1 Tax=Nostoc sphaeroides CCNUC1 TaxID=2653204 RepID=A0A5P8WES2_9NOSO|nr:hypothetical protein GXM_07893 [Nostoc sphaeroides CCNUC1]